MALENVKKEIIDKFHEKRIYYIDQNGENREKQISKKEAKDLAESVYLLDPTENKRYFNALDKSYLKENKDLYNWIISAYYSNNKRAKDSLKELHKSLKEYDDHIELFDVYDRNFNNFTSIADFINKVDEVLMSANVEKEEEEKKIVKQKDLTQKKKELHFLKDKKVVDGKIFLGTEDIYKNDFLNIFELNEIKKFSNTDDLDYNEFFETHDIKISSDILNTYIHSITKDDDSFYKFAYDIVKSNDGLYSIIDIEEEINEKSINTINDYNEFKETISIESIFQYFSEFMPDIYEFFELSIVAGAHNKLLQKVQDLFKKINSSGTYVDDNLNCAFLIKVNKPFKYDIYVHPKSTKKIYELDKKGKIDKEIISLDMFDKPTLSLYVAHNRIIDEFSDEYTTLMNKIEEFNNGGIREINYSDSKSYIQEKIPELKEKFTK